MAKYDEDDIMTIYFVVKKDRGESIIQAWSDDKKMVESYMTFHNCKKFSVKKVTRESQAMYQLMEENLHDKISLVNITTRDPKHKHDAKSITVPMTETELTLLNSETNTFMSSYINYSYINDALCYFKHKYMKILDDIGLFGIIHKILYSKSNITGKYNDILSNVDFDQLILFYRLYPENFD